MKPFFVFIMLTISANVMARDILTEAIIMGDFSCLDDAIDIEDIRYFSKHDLRLLRNTIFAKNGYIFFSDDLNKHFSRFLWYHNDEVNLKKELTRTDWVNVALIQSLERNVETDFQENMTKHFLSDRIYGLDEGTRVENIQFDGEIIASFNHGIEIARAKITDNEFHLDMAEIPSNMLEHWEGRFDEGWLYCSDPETKTGHLSLYISGTMINADGKTHTLSRGLSETKIDYFIYSDRDAIIRGAFDGELYTENAYRKVVWNMTLKKGWNKIKSGRKTNTGKYNVTIYESTAEKGDFGIEIDPFKEQPEATIQGKIGLDTHPELPHYYVLLKKPMRATINDYEESPASKTTANFHKLVVFFDENIDKKTFSSKDNYILHGSFESFLYRTRGKDEIVFYAMEIETEKGTIFKWLTETSWTYKMQTKPWVFIFPALIIGIVTVWVFRRFRVKLGNWRQDSSS